MKKFFLIGIAGSGMSSLAYLLAEKGCEVFGFDDQIQDAKASNLLRHGIHILDSNQIDSIDLKSFDCAVFSTAIDINKHSIALIFQKNKIPLLHRSEILHWAFSQTKSISVSGSHGKTTTTGMISFVLQKLNRKPQVMIGGEASFLENRGGTWGRGEWGVYESDESDGSFLKYDADIKVITNLDNDHLDFYKTRENLETNFIKFINQNSNSQIILNLTDNGLQKISDRLDFSNILAISNKELRENQNYILYKISDGVLSFEKSKKNYTIKLKVGGEHYLQNALCAVLSLEKTGIALEESTQAIYHYPSVKRRLEFLGQKNQVSIFDDYGHHPTEIASVLQSFPKNKRLIVVFQPHRYTRTQLFYRDFAQVLSRSDFLFLLPIYSSGEEKIEDVNQEKISNLLKCDYQNLSGDIENDILEIEKKIKSGDNLLFLGAGNVRLWGEKLLKL